MKKAFTHIKDIAHTNLSDRQHKVAFTLAEVLITLGIIGVVAALTLPSVIQKHQEQRRVAQLKKAYSAVSQAFSLIINENGTVDTWGYTLSSTGERDENGNYIVDFSAQRMMVDYLKKYLKTVDIEYGEKDVYTLDNRKKGITSSNEGSTVQLTDGTQIAVGWFNHLPSACAIQGTTCADLWIDLPDSKNFQIGVTRFAFTIQKDRIIPATNYGFKSYCDKENKVGDSSSIQGRGCTIWVIQNGNMDYLHCSSASLVGKTKCK